MMRSRRMLLSASATAALLGASASGAWAFDEVNWTWDKTITQTETIIVNVTTNVEPDGLVQVEKMQINIGDTNARAIVNGIDNNAGGTGTGPGGSILINEDITFLTGYDDEPDPGGIDPAGPTDAGPLRSR